MAGNGFCGVCKTRVWRKYLDKVVAVSPVRIFMNVFGREIVKDVPAGGEFPLRQFVCVPCELFWTENTPREIHCGPFQQILETIW